MNKYTSDRLLYICIVIALYFNVIICIEYSSSLPFSGSFDDILKELESRVFIKTKEGKSKLLSTTERYLLRNNENTMSKGQKATLKDALMMKLVSYYENKYKLFHPDVTPESTTTNYRTYYGYNNKIINEVELINETPVFDNFVKKTTSNSVPEVVIV